MPSLPNGGNTLQSAQDGIYDMSENVSSSLSQPTPLPTPNVIERPIQAPKYNPVSSSPLQRGRMLWSALPKSSSSPSIAFKSPALVGEGAIAEQSALARSVARVKARSLVGHDNFTLMQAGGFGKYYDEEDMARDLP